MFQGCVDTEDNKNVIAIGSALLHQAVRLHGQYDHVVHVTCQL